MQKPIADYHVSFEKYDALVRENAALKVALQDVADYLENEYWGDKSDTYRRLKETLKLFNKKE